MTTSATARFLRDYHLFDWYGLNPSHKPLSAATPAGIYTFLRLAVPSLGGMRDARVAEAVREAGYRVVHDGDGFVVEECSAPPQSGDGPRDRGAVAAAAPA